MKGLLPFLLVAMLLATGAQLLQMQRTLITLSAQAYATRGDVQSLHGEVVKLKDLIALRGAVFEFKPGRYYLDGVCQGCDWDGPSPAKRLEWPWSKMWTFAPELRKYAEGSIGGHTIFTPQAYPSFPDYFEGDAGPANRWYANDLLTLPAYPELK